MGRGVIKPHSALPKGEECLTGWVFAWLLEVGWCVARLCLVYKNQRGTKKERLFSIQSGRFFAMKKAFPCIKEVPSSIRKDYLKLVSDKGSIPTLRHSNQWSK